MEVLLEGLPLGSPDRLHRRFQRRAVRVCHNNGELDCRPNPPAQWVSFRPPRGTIRIRFQCATLGQRRTKRTVDVRNGCTFALLAKVIQFLLQRVLHDVSRYVGPDSIKHCLASACCKRSHSSRVANLALAQCALARAAIPCLILNLIVVLRG